MTPRCRPSRTTRAVGRLALGAAVTLAASVATGCPAPSAGGGKRGTIGKGGPGRLSVTTSPSPAVALAASEGVRGQVLGEDGTPAAGVEVRAWIVSNHGGGIVANHGAGVVSNHGGAFRTLLGWGEAWAPAAGSVRGLAQADTTRTGPDGRFSLTVARDAQLNVEAKLRDDVRAFVAGAGAAAELTLRLKKTGAIRGRVVAPAGSGATDLTGTSVFVPGSSYLAKAGRDGAYRIDHVPEGSFTLAAEQANLGRATLQAVAVVSERTTEAPELVLQRLEPRITSLEPAVLNPGGTLLITGQDFGREVGAVVEVSIGGLAVTQAAFEGDGRLRVAVPEGVAEGRVVVTVDGRDSAPASAPIIGAATARLWASGPIRPGESTFVSWRAQDGRGAPVDEAPASWSVAGDAVTVENGRVVGRTPGKATVRCAFGAVKAEVAVEVAAGPAVRTFVGYPEPAYMAADEAGLAAAYAARRHDLLEGAPIAPAAALTRTQGIDLSEGALYVGQTIAAPVSRIDLATGGVEVVRGTEGAVKANLSCDFVEHVPGRGLYLALWTLKPQLVRVPPDGGQDWLISDDPGFVDGPVGPTAGAQMRGPLDLVAAPDGTLYVVDDKNHAVRAILPDRRMVTIAGTGQAGYQDGPGASARFTRPIGLALDGRGGLLVSETGQRVRRVDLADPAHPVTTIAGTGAAGSADGPRGVGAFDVPAGLAVGADGTIYVADRNNNRIRTIAADGTLGTLCGATEAGAGDGDAGAARFSEPVDLALDAERGYLFVTDRANGRVRIVRL